ncbi:MAG: hypothetical protein QJR00_05310 [Bacillota bacterium]|nr:hypothetical protein [Bacillota bacterium]
MFRRGWGRQGSHPLVFYVAFLAILAFMAGHWVFARAVEIYTGSILIISFPGVAAPDLAQRILEILRWAGFLSIATGALVMAGGLALYWAARSYLQKAGRLF